MEPIFKTGQSLLVSSLPYFFGQPKVGDVVVIKDPQDGKPLLKRIAKIRPRRSTASRPTRPKYFVVGDNPNHSTDSRMFGPVSIGKVIGYKSTL